MKSRSYPQLFPARGITRISKELLGDNFTWTCKISFHQLLSWKEECSYGESRGQYLGYLVSAPWQEGMWPSSWVSASQDSAPPSQLRTKICLYHFTLNTLWKCCCTLLLYNSSGEVKIVLLIAVLWNRIFIYSWVANAKGKVSSVQ